MPCALGTFEVAVPGVTCCTILKNNIFCKYYYFHYDIIKSINI